VANDQGLAGESDATPEEIAQYYDDWATAGYDADVLSWGYEAPQRATSMVVSHLAGTRAASLSSARVLDAGCGTGQVGVALTTAGLCDITGGDFTPASVQAARARGVYAAVDHLDLNGRLSFDDDSFDVAVSVGVFSYLQDTAATLAELVRVVRPSGAVIFTQRTDLWAERNCDEILADLAASGRCDVTTSDVSPYLPGHPEFGDQIGIIYTTVTVGQTVSDTVCPT